LRRLLLLALVLLGFAAPAACESGTHAYVGRLYLEERKCLGTTSSLDAVEGEPPGDCEARCFIQTSFDARRAVYVSKMCAPYPYGFDTSGTDPACPDALAALTRGDTCLTDGGSTAPLEAGAPETGAEAGPADAGTD